MILAASNNPWRGEIKDAHILDLAPTLLELGGNNVPSTMQGNSLTLGHSVEAATDIGYSPSEEISMSV